jgi:hypothetical protein
MSLSTTEEPIPVTKATEKFKVKSKEFTGILRKQIELKNSIFRLGLTLAKAGKGSLLISVPNSRLTGNEEDEGVTEFHFDHTHLAAANDLLDEEMMSSKDYFKFSIKKSNDQLGPESFRQIYAPVFCGEALRLFISDGNFGLRNPAAEGKTPTLLESMPLAAAGYAMRNTITQLFYIYVFANGLFDSTDSRNATTDEHMDTVFGGAIPAAYYNRRLEGDEDHVEKITMEAYTERGGEALNTYQVISSKKNKDGVSIFDPKNFSIFSSCQSIAAINYYSMKALKEDEAFADQVAFFKTEEVQARLLEEHTIAAAARKEWRDIIAKRKEKQNPPKTKGKK